MKSVEEQMRIIAKGAKEIVGEEDLRNKLVRAIAENRGLTIKLGLDPSAPDIHLGHSVVLRKIRQMQDLGHRAVIVIGDFTGRIGDPTGKSKGRAALSEEQVKENAKTYTDQIFEIVDQEKTEVVFNSSWLKQLDFEEVIRLAASVTVARILERDDFTERYKNNVPIGLHEFFYPLMQAYDSVALKADIEIGGTDQTFNILMGRSLQKWMGMEAQAAVFMPILEGLDGVEKMSKSLGNYIGIHEPAEVMFKKVMEVPDSLIIRYYELVTDEHPDAVARLKEELTQGRNPRDVKYELARIVTNLYHKDEAANAEKYYKEAFMNKGIPESIPELVIDLDKDTLAGIIPKLIEEEYVKSGSEFRRILSQGGTSLNGRVLTMEELDQVLICGDVIKIGKKKFAKIIK
ncbi:tyrosine--tRNA ligase [Anaerocolumna xylanovorans]|uniref:Tyrosine--tRNA ligase n=1 Tax=Anaerocolumna xylanovorans DSM 12503 TaxID=1121345 RepID=A0A1M7YCQ6_9FIRM|nr:tyrosine--tRNA ligase [Anaerocolumna xylanovorans]SHO50369.1 tyrosyl-tRNA synthetase [Anaerocolumna xylanovorans DSM 12503]